MGIAKDAFSDGRISAVSITDNPGGNPSLSPDAIGFRIFSIGMDVIVHFTCRDMNRVGMESRALQLAMIGMKNILALTGDYSGKGFGGQGAPVFDLDSVNLHILFTLLTKRIKAAGDPDGFFAGCAVSPFKFTEGECVAQYAKMSRKVAAGARFVITQLGYDAAKFHELINIQHHMGIDIPSLGSVYVLSPGARHHASGACSGRGGDRRAAEDRAAGVAGQAGREKGGHRAGGPPGGSPAGAGIPGCSHWRHSPRFRYRGLILDRMEEIKNDWEAFLPEFNHPQPGGFYAFQEPTPHPAKTPLFGRNSQSRCPLRKNSLRHAAAGPQFVFQRRCPPGAGI
jgi:methylenetetrahydrofolate reductase (NADPH)